MSQNSFSTSKLVVFEGSGLPLQLREVEIPALKPGEILIKNEYTTLCRSDLATYTGRRNEKTPTILGHEIVGRVVATYEDEPMKDEHGRQLAVGDRVTWAIYAADRHDPMAMRGIPQKAHHLFKYGHEQLTETSTLHGGLAEYTILRPHTPVIVLREDLPLQAASIINCAVSTVTGSVRLAGEVKGQSVVVLGAGMLGIIACAYCREQGASEVIAVDMNDARLAQALRFGATRICKLDELKAENRCFNVMIDYSGAIACMEASVELLAIGGTAVWVGGVFPQGKLGVDPEQIIRRLLTVKGLHNYNAEDFRAAVDFLETHHTMYPFNELVRGGFTLSQAEEAFSCALTENPYRVGVSL